MSSEHKTLMRPNSDWVLEVLSTLKRRGIDIPYEQAEVVFAAVIEWIKSKEGAKFVGDLLGFDIQEGRSDTEYIVMDGFGREKKISPQQILFLGAAVINGEPTPMNLVKQSEKPTKVCDLCNLDSHCVKLVKNQETKDTVLACNNCLVHNHITSLRDEGDPQECHDCIRIECAYHPLKETWREEGA